MIFILKFNYLSLKLNYFYKKKTNMPFVFGEVIEFQMGNGANILRFYPNPFF